MRTESHWLSGRCASLQVAADAALPALLTPPDEETPSAAFVVLHRGLSGAWLNAYSWVWGNVINCQAAEAGPDGGEFKEMERRWIGCVWELAPFEHERAAWVRHVL